MKLRDGTIVNESITAVHVTYAADVAAVFKCGERIVKFITIHHWGVYGQIHEEVVAYLAKDNDRDSSAHAVLSAGKATSLVSPDDAAWQCGNALGNTQSIGLECHPEASDGDYITVAAYIVMLRGIYGDIPLVPHSYWKATACPGNWDLARLDKLARSVTQIEEDMPLTVKDIEAIGDEVLNREIKRAGGQAGVTSLRSVVAYFDSNVALVIHSTVAGVIAASPNASAADISAAVHDAIKGSQITFTAQ